MSAAPTPWRVVLLGCGNIAPVHVEAMRRSGRFELVGVADPDPAAASRGPERVPFFACLEETLPLRPDLVVVATPPDSHAKLAVAALRRGARVLVEKPVAMNEAELSAMEDAAGAGAPRIFCALHAAEALDVRWLAQWIDREQPGPLTRFASSFDDPLWDGHAIVPRGRRLGGAWWDSGINALSVLGRFIDPAALRVERTHVRAREQDGTVLAQEVTFSGPEGVIRVDWTRGSGQKTTQLRFDRTGWSATLDHTAETVTLTRRDGSQRVETLANGTPRLVNHYTGVYEQAAHWLAGGRSNAAHARDLHRVLWAVATPP